MYETDEDSERVAETEGISSFVSKPKVEIENKNPGEKLKCEHCDFVGQTNAERSKHVSTKHPIKSVETADDLEGVEGIEDMFQIEYLEGEQVYACNICDEGFDKEAEIHDHIGLQCCIQGIFVIYFEYKSIFFLLKRLYYISK